MLQYVTVPFINLKIQAKILIDSGAMLSLIKQNLVPNNQIDPTKKAYITGITSDVLSTLGSTFLKINDERFEFQVVSSDFQIPYDGILGINCLRNHKLRLDKGYLEINGARLTLRSTCWSNNSEKIIQNISENNPSKDIYFLNDSLTFNEEDYLSGYKPDFLIDEEIFKTVDVPHNIENTDVSCQKLLDPLQNDSFTIDTYPEFLTILRENTGYSEKKQNMKKLTLFRMIYLLMRILKT